MALFSGLVTRADTAISCSYHFKALSFMVRNDRSGHCQRTKCSCRMKDDVAFVSCSYLGRMRTTPITLGVRKKPHQFCETLQVITSLCRVTAHINRRVWLAPSLLYRMVPALQTPQLPRRPSYLETHPQHPLYISRPFREWQRVLAIMYGLSITTVSIMHVFENL